MGGTTAGELASLKVADLKILLLEKGLSTSGKKGDLIERLLASHSEQTVAESTSQFCSSAAVSATEGGDVLSAEVASETRASAPLSLDPSQISSIASAPSAPSSATGPTSTNSRVASNQTKKPLTEEEKLAARKAKFGVVTDEDRLQARAKRFGISTPETEDERKRRRAQRFGLACPNQGDVEAERRRKRAERFGVVDEDSKRQKRALRFGIVSEDQKLQQRLARFATGTKV